MRKLTVLILGALALIAAACSSTPATTSSTTSGAQEITVEATEFKFAPATIEVMAGRPVKMTLRNKGAIEHDWAIQKIAVTGMKESAGGGHAMSGADKPALHMNAMAGQMGQVEFTPTEKGTYQISCTVAGHKEAGMMGTLVVK